MDAHVPQCAALGELTSAEAPSARPDLRRRPGRSERHQRLDALRGIAIVWMVGFHFAFDLATFKLTDANFYRDPFWTWQRTVIVSLFLLCAGVGQAVAVEQAQPWRRFWRRWSQVAVCALLVSAGSALMFPGSWISFGVLHGMAVMLVVCRCSPRAGRWLWSLGLLALLLPSVVRHPLFDSRWTNWLGLVTHKPVTEDWVPVLPWLGVMWWGLAVGAWLLAHRRHWLTGALPPLLRPLAWLGDHSLTVYIVHQPLLIGALMAWMRWRTG